MRIALISTPFVPLPPPRYGGTELVVHNLAEELVARGHEVTVYATGDSRTSANLRHRFETALWPPNAYRELDHAAFAIQDILAHDRFDVIHAHCAPPLAFARLVDVPIVYTVHHVRDDILHDLYAQAATPSVTFIAISERQRALMRDVCDARVVHHGLCTELYPLGDGRGRYAAFLGRFSDEKGPAVAIDAATQVNVPIQLGGNPHWQDEVYFRAEVEPRLRRPGVTWIGEANHAQKVKLLGGAAATLMPIAWEEPFGLVMVESMLVGTPVLAFAMGAARELIDEGVTGWIVRDADEMAWRLRRLAKGADRFDRRRCLRRARERFSVERMTDRYLAIYEEAATGARPAVHA